MKSIKLISKDSTHYAVKLPAPNPDIKSAYIFAFAKSGSTLLDNMITVYCAKIGVPTFSLYNAAFGQGVPTKKIQQDAAQCFSEYGYIYTGFRHFPAFDLNIGDAKAIWLVRDPRDMLVSLYFSLLKSHKIPKVHKKMKERRQNAEQLSIDQFAIENAPIYVNHFARYKKLLRNKNVSSYRYEDVIYDKVNWLGHVVSNLGLDRNARLIKKVAQEFDVIPSVEDDGAHVRQVHPGNHKIKLARDTVLHLNEQLGDFLEHFKYET